VDPDPHVSHSMKRSWILRLFESGGHALPDSPRSRFRRSVSSRDGRHRPHRRSQRRALRLGRRMELRL
jgi:hypothetical protein